MTNEATLDDLLGRLRDGDEQAATEIFRRFSSRIVKLARSRLSDQMRQKVDPEDVMQSVFRSFFVRQSDGRFELSSWDDLWSLLVRITIRKCGRKATMFRAARRDVGREVMPNLGDDDSRRCWEGLAREPTPHETACLADTLEKLLGGLNKRQRQIVVLRLQGYGVNEISEQVQRTSRTIHRDLSHTRELLSKLVDNIE